MYSYIHVAQANNTDPGRKKKKKQKLQRFMENFFNNSQFIASPPMGGGCTVYGIRYTVYMVYGRCRCKNSII